PWGGPRSVDRRPYGALAAGGLRAARAPASSRPSISTVLIRAVWPRATRTADLGTPSALASSTSSAALAWQSAGAARTRARTSGRPAVAVSTAPTRSAPPRGVSRTRSRATAGRSAAEQLVQRHAGPRQQVELDARQDQQRQDRGDVDAAQRRNDPAQRIQQRPGHGVEEGG